jgi:hypothetical protein
MSSTWAAGSHEHRAASRSSGSIPRASSGHAWLVHDRLDDLASFDNVDEQVATWCDTPSKTAARGGSVVLENLSLSECFGGVSYGHFGAATVRRAGPSRPHRRDE